MKNKQFTAATHPHTNPVFYKTAGSRRIPALLPADSQEVKMQYYRERIAYLYKELDELNLLEHPVEIAFYCGEIGATKKLLQALEAGAAQPKRKRA